jgi:flagellar protein FliO/FliZ
VKRYGPLAAWLIVALWTLGAHGADEGSSAPLPGRPIAPTQLVRTLLGLAGVVALIVAAGWTLRRMGRSRWHGDGALRVLGALAVGPRERVVLLQVGARQVLLGVAPGNVRRLLVLDEPLPAEAHPAAQAAARAVGDGAGFRRRLQAAMQGPSDADASVGP